MNSEFQISRETTGDDMNHIKHLLLLVLIVFFSCNKNKMQLNENDLPSLKDTFKENFLIGTAIEDYQLDNPSHAQLLLKHFSSVTAENVMKPELIHPDEDRFDFSRADRIVSFAEKNNIAIRGHTLIWHNQVPGWFFMDNGKPVSKDKLRHRMKNHIKTVMDRYKGQIYAWDVVNEAVDADQPDGLRKSQWYNILGEEYIELAFRYARESDPQAKLFLNDYATCVPNKRQKIIGLINRLKQKGVPIDGIGMQMHISLKKPSLYDLESTLIDFSKTGLEINITEMDITVYEDTTSSYSSIGKEVLDEQGYRVADIFSIIKKYEKFITSVTFWGMTDEHTWLKYFFTKRNDWPLPFDDNLKVKPFYWGMTDPSRLNPR